MPASSKEFFDIQCGFIECGFTLKRVSDMRTLCGYAEKEQADTVLLQSLNENKKAKKVVFERE